MEKVFNTALSKYISGTLVFVLVANIVLFGVLMTPKSAQANMPVIDATAAAQRGVYGKFTVLQYWQTQLANTRDTALASQTTMQYLWEQIKSPWGLLREIAKALALVMVHQMLAKTTNDIVAWINGGGKGDFRKQVRVMQDYRKFLSDSVDEAGGVLMGAILGVDSKTLCDASFLKQKLAPAFLGPYAVPTFNEKVACTFTGMADGLRKFKEDFRNGGWRSWIEYTQMPNNQIGQTLIISNWSIEEKAKSLEAAKVEVGISKGFLAQKRCTIAKLPTGDSNAFYSQREEGVEDEELQMSYTYTITERRGFDVAGFSQSDLGKPLEEISGKFPGLTIEELRGMIISNGGRVDCKIVTPAEQLSELATLALEAPVRTMEGILTGLMNQLPNGGGFLRPYLNAIAGASLNLMLNKEKGLISGWLTPPKKDRKISQRSSDAVQKNTAHAGSAGQIAASANDFQSFIMKSLINFSVFVSTAAQVMDESDVLGRLPINRLEYAREKGEDPQGGKYKSGESKYVTHQFLYSDTNPEAKVNVNGVDVPTVDVEGWKTNVDCEAALANITSSPDHNPGMPFAVTSTLPFDIYINTSGFDIRVANCVDNSGETILGKKMFTTYSSGKILFEEAQWCGAYAQETPLDVDTSKEPVMAYATTTVTNILYLYDDDNSENGNDVKIDRVKRATSSSDFVETLIFPHTDVNFDNMYDLGATTTSDAMRGLPALDTMRPNLVDEIRDKDGTKTGSKIAKSLAQAAVADDYLIGGYNSGGFINEIRQISTDKVVASLPVPLAGAETVYYPPEKRVYIFGGRNMSGYSDAIYEFDINSKEVRTMAARLPSPAYGMTGAYYPDTQRVYLFGGKTGATETINMDGEPDAVVTEASVSDQILEFNQQMDAITVKNSRLPNPLAHASAVPLFDQDNKIKIFIFGGMDESGQAVGTILAYDPRDLADNGSIKQKNKLIQQRGYLAAVPTDTTDINTSNYKNSKAIILGGEDVMGRWDIIQEYDALTNSVIDKTPLDIPLTQTARSLERAILIGGITDSPATDASSRIYPQGDVYYIPGSAEAVSKRQIILLKYFSPTYENASVSLLNTRDDRAYRDPTLVVRNPLIYSELNSKGDEVYLPKDAFYSELPEKIQDLAEKLRILNGYHYNEPNRRDYEAGIAQQVGSAPDDDPSDNNPRNPLYPDRPTNATNEANCKTPYEWDEDLQQCLRKGYKGSVSDVTTKYKNITEIYQVLYSGATDERALEGIDPNMTILSPTETNIKLSLIGARCPTLPPSGTSTPETKEGCPIFGEPNGQYNMGKRFMFEGDDTSQNPTGLTTGFATNPFNNKKSSSLAGILNLDEMATQLQAVPPDKNIVKLIRLRQILEQLQVWESITPGTKNYQKSIREIRTPDSSESLRPDALTGVDTIRVSLFGFEKIQDWLNATSTSGGAPARNKDIQELIEAYGYTNAKEAYPEISKDLDTILQDAIGQVTDKTREVFVKRTEESMEQARLDAEYRLRRFIEYARDLNSEIKLSLTGSSALRMGNLIDPINDRINDDLYVLRAEPFTNSPDDPRWVRNIINGKTVTNNERSGLVGAAVYKITNLAKFIGMNTESVEFTAMMTQYRQGSGETQEQLEKNLNDRLEKSAVDVYLLYRGVSDQTNPKLSVNEKARTARPTNAQTNTRVSGTCGFDSDQRIYFCDLNASGTNGAPIRIYKDASMKIKKLRDDFGLMMEEFSKIKEEFMETINNGQSQKQDFDNLLADLYELDNHYNKTNECVGMINKEWTPPIYVHELLIGMGGSAAIFLTGLATGGLASLIGVGTFGIGAISTGLLILSTVWVLPLVIGIAVIDGIINSNKARKAKKKYREKINKIVDECKAGLRDYNRALGQFADNFICGRANKIYENQ